MDQYLSVKLKAISFFLIIMVIFLHAHNLNTGNLADHKGYSWCIQTFISGGLALVSVPLFFLISGYLFFLNLKGTAAEFKLKIKKRFNTLLIPYIFWSLWGMLIFIILQSLPQSKPFFNNSPILHFSALQFLNTLLLDPLPYQLWFIRDLMMLVVVSPALYFILKKLNYFAVIICIVPWIYDFTFHLFNSQSLLFFMLGGYIALWKKEIAEIRLSAKYLWMILFWVAMAAIKTILLLIDYPSFFIINQVHKLCIIAGVFSVWKLYDTLVAEKDITDWKIYPIFSYTFFMYAFQEPMLTILKKGLLFAIGKSEAATLSIYFITILTTIGISLVVAASISKIMPRFYALITGGR